MATMRILVNLYQLEQQIIQAKNKGNLIHALGLYNELIEIKQQISNRLGIAKTYAEQGALFAVYGDQKEALNSFLKASEIAQKSKNPEFLNIINEQILHLKKEY